ncbi:MAG: OmpA family protein [Myxococcota bacterium]
MRRAPVTFGICVALSMLASPARAGESETGSDVGPADSAGSAEGGVVLTGSEGKAKFEADQKAEREQLEETQYKRTDQPWIKRWRPERHMINLGIYGGVLLPDADHDLYDPRTAPQEPLWAAGPDVGLRLGYYPLRVLGFEGEFSANPTRVRSITNDFAFVYGFRGHAVAQLPFHSVTPFFLAGYGAMGVRSNIILLGNDLDPAFHYGGGVKVSINRRIGVRVEARNIVSSAEARQDSGTSHLQMLAGLTISFNRGKPKPLPPPQAYEDPDRDGDGFLNESDECPDAAGVAPHGCPDTDGDGFRDSEDACPEVPGVAPKGCPDQDTDGDRIMDSVDKCIDEPEVYNGLDDADGCPDELPPEIKEFEGAIEGIEFDFGKATIRSTSTSVLDKAVAVMTEYEDVRVKIVGHTDNVGDPEANKTLSQERADAVKKYLTDAGIAADRVETEGRGDADPRDTNDTDEGRARNRRIEFEILVRGPNTDDGDDAKAASEPADAAAEPASE